MKRPVIKGTPLHKASIAKAKAESIVAQTRTQADGGLVGAGDALGKSYIPAAIDYSIDQKAIKIPKGKEKPNPKPKEEEEIDMDELLKEDEDEIVDAGLDDERAVNPNKKEKGYKNWRVRAEEENIRLAEENKARVDAETAEKVKRRDYKVSKIKPKNIEQLPTTAPETKLEQAGPAPESKPGKGKAHENPDYEAKEPTTNSEGETISFGSTPPQNPGYSYNEENDQWTYNDIPVDGNEVPKTFVDSVDAEAEETRNIDLNRNTPSNDSTSVDLIPQPQADTTASTNTEQTLTPRQARKKKLADKKYNDPNTGPKVKEQMIKEGYNPIQSKSPAQMRDDRIYRNARADGPVRKNMIKSGYTPQ